MALISSAGSFALLLVLFFVATAFGLRALAIFEMKADQALDNLVFASGIGFATLQLLTGVTALAYGLTAASAIALLAAMGVAAWSGWQLLARMIAQSFRDLRLLLGTNVAKAIGLCILIFAGMEALLATAPLTGSDAMHYHFTTPLLQIGKPEQPIFWLTHSFLAGLGHELIGLGLVLGGDKLALLMIFLSGCMTAAALLQLARRLMPVEWALAAVLTFLMAPMVFWQIGTAGSPDIWMGFYALLATLAIGQAGHRWMVLASVYSGAAASIKYTGWILPAVVVLSVIWISRSFRWAAICSAAAVIMGIVPALRNFIWTGDPFFPFLTQWIGKVGMNSYGLAMLRADVHSHAYSNRPLSIIYFLLTMGFTSSSYGLGNYFGPVVLSFLPLLVFCDWRMRIVKLAGALWFAMLVTNAFTTQMARFLLPAFPLALALVFCGAAVAFRKGGRIVRIGCAGTVVAFLLFCLASDSLYANDFLKVSLGLESKEVFLERMAPDYPAATFVNSEMSRRQGKVLVPFRHLYYLRVPYENGDPDTSWTINPDLLTSPQALLAYLKDQNIGWVVKTSGYPDSLAAIAAECEKEGKLLPEEQSEVEVFGGIFRSLNNRFKVPIVLLRVVN